MPSTQTERLRGLTTSIAVKAPVRVASTANLTLSSSQVIDGITLASSDRERVLVWQQTNSTENGIYEVRSAAWQRASDFDGERDATRGTLIYVSTGVFYGGRFFAVTSTGINVPGSSVITLASAGVFGSTITVSTFAETLLDDSSATNMRTTLSVAGTTEANAFRASQEIASTGAISLTLTSTDPDASEMPSLFMNRNSSSPAANDLGGNVVQRFNNTASTLFSGVKWGSVLVTATTGAEDCQGIIVTRQGGSLGTRVTAGAGVQIGAPTGGDKGIGTLNCSSDIYSNNSSYNNPDFVVEHWATGKIERFADRPGSSDYPGLLPLPHVASFMRANLHLPRVSRESMGIFSRSDLVLEKIEELFIHLIEIDGRVQTLERHSTSRPSTF